MKEKYTAIYRESWLAGSHWQTLICTKRFERKENETMEEALIREKIDDCVEYIFEGREQLA